jgi:hypothetical protein
MNITLDGYEVRMPHGNYEDKDDMLCRGCGSEIGIDTMISGGHTVVDCLRTLREAVIELQKESLEGREKKVQLYGREDIENHEQTEIKEGK